MKKVRFPWLATMTWIILSLVILPIAIIIPSSFTSVPILSFPPKGFSLRWYAKIFERPEFLDSLIYSLKLAALTAILAAILGTLAAVALAKANFRGKSFVNAFLLSPLILPSLIIGIAILMYLSYMGLAGSFLGLLLGHLVISIPYIVRLVLTGLSSFDYNLEKAAAIMGATPARAFWDITLPLIRPALLSGAIFAFLVSFDNVTISLFLISANEKTLPILLFGYIQDNLDPMVAAVSTGVILLSLIPVVILEKVYGLDRLFGLNNNAH